MVLVNDMTGILEWEFHLCVAISQTAFKEVALSRGL